MDDSCGGVLFIGLLLLVVYWLAKGKRSKPEKPSPPAPVLHMEVTGTRSGNNDKPRIRTNFREPVPAGWQIAETAVSVAGLRYRKVAAREFVRGFDHAVRLEPEPNNPRDPNAIKVIGIYAKRSGGAKQETRVGYVPSEMAATLHDAGLTARVRGQLQNVYEGDNGYLGVRFDLLCLAEDLQRWKDS